MSGASDQKSKKYQNETNMHIREHFTIKVACGIIENVCSGSDVTDKEKKERIEIAREVCPAIASSVFDGHKSCAKKERLHLLAECSMNSNEDQYTQDADHFGKSKTEKLARKECLAESPDQCGLNDYIFRSSCFHC